MENFTYQNNELYVENVAVKKIAESVGSPVFIYSLSSLQNRIRSYQEALQSIAHTICYSMKCNSNIAVLKAVANEGAGVDIVSGGELFRALKAGVDPKKIVFSGVGKTKSEIAAALKANILMFNVESVQELDAIQEVAANLEMQAPIALRVNPDVDPKTHPYITTGLKESKFGIHIDDVLEVYRAASQKLNIDVLGVDCHIGSQLTETQPFEDALDRVLLLVKQLRDANIPIRYLDLGGGLGIQYNDEEPPSVQNYAQSLLTKLEGQNLELILEPGRSIMANAGILVTQTLYRKSRDSKEFVIVDAAMNDLIRPAFYGGFHDVWPVEKRDVKRMKADIVGPICESGDFLAKDRDLPDFQSGELMAIMSSGAYGFVMSSNYNTRARAAEVLVQGDQYYVIRQRETLEQLIENESIPDILLEL